MFADWPAEEDDVSFRRHVWRGSDVALGFMGILLGFAAVIALGVAIAAISGVTSDTGADVPGALVTMGFEALLGAIVLLLAARRRLSLRQLGLHRPPDGGRVVTALVGAYATFIAYQFLLDAIRRLGVDVSRFNQGNPIPTGPHTGVATWVLLGIAVVVIAPVTEELFFRAFVFRAIAGAMPMWPAFLLSGLAFALFHLNASVLVPFTFVGAFFAWSYWRSGSLWTSITAHAIVNGASFVFTVTGMIK